MRNAVLWLVVLSLLAVAGCHRHARGGALSERQAQSIHGGDGRALFGPYESDGAVMMERVSAALTASGYTMLAFDPAAGAVMVRANHVERAGRAQIPIETRIVVQLYINGYVEITAAGERVHPRAEGFDAADEVDREIVTIGAQLMARLGRPVMGTMRVSSGRGWVTTAAAMPAEQVLRVDLMRVLGRERWPLLAAVAIDQARPMNITDTY